MRWMRTGSHAELDGQTLGLGLMMMMLANERGRREDGSGALVSGSDKPMSMKALARELHVNEPEVKSAIQALMDAGTMERRDGYLVFPNLQRWQESPSAGRVRRWRERQGELGVAGQSRAKPKRKEQAAADALKAIEMMGRGEEVEAVCLFYVQSRKSVQPRARPRPTDLERGLVASRLLDGATTDDVCDAIQGCHGDEWHVQVKKLDLEYIVRTPEQVEKFRNQLAPVVARAKRSTDSVSSDLTYGAVL